MSGSPGSSAKRPQRRGEEYAQLAGPSAVMQEIAARKFRRLYVLFGSDPTLAEEIITMLKQRVVVKGLESFDLESVHAADIGSGRPAVSELLQHLRQPPVGSSRRLVIVRDLELLDKRVGRTLCAGLAGVPESSTVAITCDYDQAWAGIFRDAGLTGHIVPVAAPTGAALRQLVLRWAAGHGLRLDSAAVTELINVVGEETALLKSEVEKLATVYGSDRTVRASDVIWLVSHTRLYNLSEYVSSVMAFQTGKALCILQRLAGWGEEPVKVVGWLAHRLLQQVRSATGAQQDCLQRALYRLYLINWAILEGHSEPYALLDDFTVEYCTREGVHFLSDRSRNQSFSTGRPAVARASRITRDGS